MRYDYDDKDGDNTIMSMTTISVSVHFRDLLLQLQHLLLYLSKVSYITSLVYRTYNLNMVVLKISYQVGFGPYAEQVVLQLVQPLYLLIMILQKISHQIHYIWSYPKVNLYFIMRYDQDGKRWW